MTRSQGEGHSVTEVAFRFLTLLPEVSTGSLTGPAWTRQREFPPGVHTLGRREGSRPPVVSLPEWAGGQSGEVRGQPGQRSQFVGVVPQVVELQLQLLESNVFLHQLLSQPL